MTLCPDRIEYWLDLQNNVTLTISFLCNSYFSQVPIVITLHLQIKHFRFNFIFFCAWNEIGIQQILQQNKNTKDQMLIISQMNDQTNLWQYSHISYMKHLIGTGSVVTVQRSVVHSRHPRTVSILLQKSLHTLSKTAISNYISGYWPLIAPPEQVCQLIKQMTCWFLFRSSTIITFHVQQLVIYLHSGHYVLYIPR